MPVAPTSHFLLDGACPNSSILVDHFIARVVQYKTCCLTSGGLQCSSLRTVQPEDSVNSTAALRKCRRRLLGARGEYSLWHRLE